MSNERIHTFSEEQVFADSLKDDTFLLSPREKSMVYTRKPQDALLNFPYEEKMYNSMPTNNLQMT